MSNLFTERVLNMAADTQQPEDYTGEDGLLYCGKCRTPKEAYFPEKQAALFGRCLLYTSDAADDVSWV